MNFSYVQNLASGYPDQGFCCTLVLCWGEASPEPLVSTFSLTPVTPPALDVTALCIPLAVWPLCEERTALHRRSQACQRFSRVREVQHFSCLPLNGLWCSHRTPGTTHPGNCCCFNLWGWKTAPAPSSQPRHRAWALTLKGHQRRQEEVTPGHQKCQQVTGRRGAQVSVNPLPPFKFQCLLSLAVPNIQHLSLDNESLARAESSGHCGPYCQGPKAVLSLMTGK